jgi:hypothetical protein
MKQQIFVTAVFFSFILIAPTLTRTDPCGLDRWSIKIVKDKDAKSINWKAVTTTVAEQIAIPRTIEKWKSAVRQDDESQLYKIRCELTMIGKEDDNDYHIVVRDPSTKQTMIIEIPDPACPEIKGTKLAKNYTQSRQFIDDNFGAPGKKIIAVTKKTVTVWGLGFWDKSNHGTGHSKNGREIHPVVGIK